MPMVELYERRACVLAALAACSVDPAERRRYEAEKADCERMIAVLKRVKEVKK